jgi:hypothetical protein
VGNNVFELRSSLKSLEDKISQAKCNMSPKPTRMRFNQTLTNYNDNDNDYLDQVPQIKKKVHVRIIGAQMPVANFRITAKKFNFSNLKNN